MVQFMDKTLFVGDLSKLCEEAQLFNLFNNYGTIISIKIVRGFNNTSLSYGFVVMSTEDEVRNAINYLNGVLFMGRYIKVAHAVRNELNTKRKKFKKQFINSIMYDLDSFLIILTFLKVDFVLFLNNLDE